MSNLSFLKQQPTKIVCVGLNYHCHAKELGMNTPHHPIIFIKPLTALIGPEENIIYPKMSKRVDYEAELAIIIGKTCKDVEEKDALNYVEGYTCLNDVTARDLQKIDGQWTRAKSFNTFCPIGPKIVKNINPNNVKIQSYLNGEIKQDSNTSNFIFKVEKIISFISQVMTLNPGDIIATGTPKGIGPMQKGDKIEVKIEGIGSLINYVE
ncbi:MAG: fumarylacetoacetate hydrolase family protein [Nanoarchaeota archaeon]|nr:fumarylacetoacetate hydrolase family protein [Nanoarchaeota archaeon]MBU1004432.1 fumarylacetoacetate hydrolase family protein [Nanoarchaeota archaeon]MBU1946681.1 fumarylacetoacetate hydrolase family protein [Nanoarchaeota archaeon]